MNFIRHTRAMLPVFAAALLMSCGGGDDAGDSGADTTLGGAMDDTLMPAPTDTVAAAQPMTDANILAKLSAADSMEIEQGKIARDKAANADVKAYGRMMVDDHTKMMEEGTALAQRLNITPMLPTDDADMSAMAAAMQSMSSAQGAEFDRMYIDHAVMDHQKVLDGMMQMESQAQNDAVKALIQRARPTVQKHLDRAKEIQGKLGGAAM